MNLSYEMFYKTIEYCLSFDNKRNSSSFFYIKILLKQYLINTNVTALRKEHYFKFPMSHLKNANKQASEPSVTFHDGSYALLFFFSKIFYLEADKRNAVTKT